MYIFYFFIGIINIWCLNSQVVKISAVTLNDAVTLTCSMYNDIENETGIRWYQVNDAQGVTYMEHPQIPGACFHFAGGKAYNLTRFATTCNAAQNIYTLSFTVLRADVGTSWCCLFVLFYAPIGCKDHVTISERTTTATTMRVTLPSWSLKARTIADPAYITKASTGNNWIKNKISDTDVKVIVPAVVVPCVLLIIVAIVLVIYCVRRKARKNVRETPDGMAIQYKGNNKDGWKQSLGQGKVTDNLDTVYTTPDGFIIHPGEAAISTARSYKDNKYHGATVQYSRPSPGPHHQQADYISSTYTSPRAYTHKKHHGVTDRYSSPHPGNYGNQTAYFPSTSASV